MPGIERKAGNVRLSSLPWITFDMDDLATWPEAWERCLVARDELYFGLKFVVFLDGWPDNRGKPVWSDDEDEYWFVRTGDRWVALEDDL